MNYHYFLGGDWANVYLYFTLKKGKIKILSQKRNIIKQNDELLPKKGKKYIISKIEKIDNSTLTVPDWTTLTSFSDCSFITTASDAQFLSFYRKCTRASGRSRGKRALSFVWTLCRYLQQRLSETWLAMWDILISVQNLFGTTLKILVVPSWLKTF